MSADTQQRTGQGDVLRMTAEVVSAYVGNNSLSATEISDVINAVHKSLAAIDGGNGVAKSKPAKPAVPIRRSIQKEYIVCLEDGKKLKMLKRHLRTNYSMTPEEYRAKWGLDPDYPMVAPAYAAQRSAFAKKIGLGRRPGKKIKRRSTAGRKKK